jgi:hypothetical protein
MTKRKKENSMTKRKVSRLIAVILTMAIAFTVLAVPASAASWAIEVDNVQLGEDSKPVAVVITNQAISLLIKKVKEEADGELDQIGGLLDVAGKLASSNIGKMVLTIAPQLLEQVNEQLGDGMQVKIYDGNVPKNAYVGIIGVGSSAATNWYNQTAAEKVINAVASDDAASVVLNEDGSLTVGEETIKPIPESDLKWGNNTLLYVGAAVAVVGAASAVYFYTHPAAWKKVTTTVKNTWNKITGKPTEETPAEIVEEGAEEGTGTPAENAEEGTDIQADATPTEEAPEEESAVVVALAAA